MFGNPEKEFNLNSFLSWKFLFVLSVIFYLLGGGIWEILFVIVFIMGIIDLIRQIVKRF